MSSFLQNKEKYHTHRFFHGSKFEELVIMLNIAGAIHTQNMMLPWFRTDRFVTMLSTIGAIHPYIKEKNKQTL